MNLFPTTRRSIPLLYAQVTKADSRHAKSAFCFDKNSGLLLEEILPDVRPRNVVDISCDYGSFQKIGDYRFPRDVACFKDGHHQLDLKISELSLEPSPDPNLFTPPSGAIELGNCPVAPVSARSMSTPNPRAPFGSEQSSWLMLSLVVDTKGNPQNVRVVDSGGARFDEVAINTVKGWRFWPATCNREPMPMLIYVEIAFHGR